MCDALTHGAFFILKEEIPCHESIGGTPDYSGSWLGCARKSASGMGELELTHSCAGYHQPIPTQPGPRRWTCMDYTTFFVNMEYLHIYSKKWYTSILVRRPNGMVVTAREWILLGIYLAEPISRAVFLTPACH